MSDEKPLILTWPGWYPSEEKPYQAIFIKKHLDLVARDVRLVGFHVRHRKGLKWRRQLRQESWGPLTVYEIPSFLPLKILGYFLVPFWEAIKVKRNYGKPQVFHLHVSYPYAIFSLPIRLLNIPNWVISEHWSGFVIKKKNYLSPLLYWLLRYSIKSFDAVLTVSEYLKKRLIEKFPLISNKKILIIQNPIKFPDRPPPCPDCGDKTFRFLTIGNLVDSLKNFSFLLKAFAELSKNFPHTHLDVVGDGPDRTSLEQLAKDLGIDHKVCFHGAVPNENIYTFYERCHAFVLFSRFETFSIATAEALSHGRPVVVSDCGAPAEYIKDISGVLVPQDNLETAVEGLKKIINYYHKYDPEKIYNYAKSLFNNETARLKILEVYKTSSNNF